MGLASCRGLPCKLLASAAALACGQSVECRAKQLLHLVDALADCAELVLDFLERTALLTLRLLHRAHLACLAVDVIFEGVQPAIQAREVLLFLVPALNPDGLLDGEPGDLLGPDLRAAEGLEARVVDRVLALQIEPEEGVVPQVVLLAHVLLEVEVELLEVLALDVADEARIEDVVADAVVGLPLVGERIDDDAETTAEKTRMMTM